MATENIQIKNDGKQTAGTVSDHLVKKVRFWAENAGWDQNRAKIWANVGGEKKYDQMNGSVFGGYINRQLFANMLTNPVKLNQHHSKTKNKQKKKMGFIVLE